LPHFFYDYDPLTVAHEKHEKIEDIDWAPFMKSASMPVDFDSAAYLSLAIEIQALGKEKAIVTLRDLAMRSDGTKVIPLCRLLFVAHEGRPFRAPAFGGPAECPRSDHGHWPLEPIAIVDGVPFLITDGYVLAGWPESGASYLEYCISDCLWNPERFVMPTKEGFLDASDKICDYVRTTADNGAGWIKFLKSQIARPDQPNLATASH
jgi:hypothetical protein